MNSQNRMILLIATGGGLGHAPKAPGTLGSWLGIPICYLISKMDLWYGILVCAVLVLSASWISGQAEKQLGRKDPGCIVIDEIVGLVVALLGMPMNIFTITTGFILFRVFDIAKPFPIRWIERHAPGGWGIVLDDVAAGVYANLTVRLLTAYFT